MAYYLGRDVVVALCTEDAGHGVDVDQNGTIDTFPVAAGLSAATDSLFAGPRVRNNAANSPNTNFSSADTTVFGTQDASADYSNEVSDLTAVDITMGTTDEDITYIGSKTVMKTEIKKETTVTVTRKKTNNCWDVVFNEARHGIDTADSYHGDLTMSGGQNPARSDYGYRVYIKLKTDGQVLTFPNCCITAHGITINADGVTEETMEFYSYNMPLLTAGTASTDPQSDTSAF